MATGYDNPRQFLQDLFGVAVAAADPRQVLGRFLPEDTQRKAIVIGAGKAAASMARALEDQWRGPLRGLVVTRYAHTLACERIEVVEAAHPVPDDMGEKAAGRMLHLVSDLSPEDLVICLLSGGGSALLSLPAQGISLTDKQNINRALLKSGAAISDMNCVRKHLSAIKGGRLAAACQPAALITFAISDVPGDDPAVIASGPTVPDPTTSADALQILMRHLIDIPPHIRKWLEAPASETVKPGDFTFQRCQFKMIASPHSALQAAATVAREAGLNVLVLGDNIEGESREVAKMHAAMACYAATHGGEPVKPPAVILSGGETTVTVKGGGRGGCDTEFLLSLAVSLRGFPNIYALAADTDGIDGSEDNAGAMLSPDSWSRALSKGLSATDMLENNDSYGFFQALDDLLVTGPTLTNVNDFRAILILPED